MTEDWTLIASPVVFTEEMWQNYLAMFGEENVEIVSEFREVEDGISYIRGIIRVSPDGLENAQEKAKWFHHDD